MSRRQVRLACILALMQPIAHGIDIRVGDTRVVIPEPAGCSPVTDQMGPYAQSAGRFVAPTNTQFAMFLAHEDVAILTRGGIPTPKHTFSVQTLRAIIPRFVSSADFTELKRTVWSQNKEIAGAVDRALSEAGIVLLPPHHESARCLAYSMRVTYDADDENGKPSALERAVTVTLVHVRGKVLFLYASGDKSALEWSREASKEWADAVLRANPNAEAAADDEGSSGFDWNEVLLCALIAGIIGAVLGAARLVRSAQQKKPPRGHAGARRLRTKASQKAPPAEKAAPLGGPARAQCPACGAAITPEHARCPDCDIALR